MRVIKFRVWNKSEKEMYENESKISIQSDGRISTDISLKILDSDEVIIMQFIGILDIRSNEIYEGDIFNESGSDDNEDNVYIKFNIERCCYSYYCCHDGQYIDDLGSIFYNEIKIIGNIYENPKLWGEIKMSRRDSSIDKRYKGESIEIDDKYLQLLAKGEGINLKVYLDHNIKENCIVLYIKENYFDEMPMVNINNTCFPGNNVSLKQFKETIKSALRILKQKIDKYHKNLGVEK